ncbi:transglutaminase-like domain-containing protein [Paenibacillus tarimensis]
MDWSRADSYLEPVALIIIVVLGFSVIQGFRRGASGSAKHLFFFIWEGAWSLISLVAAWRIACFVSPMLELWLQGRNITVPEGGLNTFSQVWYTFVTSLRDFSLMRIGVLLVVFYLLLRTLSRIAGMLLVPLIVDLLGKLSPGREAGAASRAVSRIAGAALGAAHGAGRALLLLAMLFVYVSLMPGAPLAGGIASSPVYQEAAGRLLEPVAGRVLAEQGPVFTKAVEAEFRQIAQRRYEVIDHDVPDEIKEAAVKLTAELESDREKAKALYDWIGTRIEYDWDKADNYIENGVWKEQTPDDTFRTRKGVCIDVARLYAVMARTAGLDVKVVTGLGADGRGGYGPHAWNEVLVSDTGRWIPLDATWASSGNWFDTADFDQTHIREA